MPPSRFFIQVGSSPFVIGSKYPNATGPLEPHTQGVERGRFINNFRISVYLRDFAESGNMLFMAYAYSRVSSDHTLVKTYVRRICDIAVYSQLTQCTIVCPTQKLGDVSSG